MPSSPTFGLQLVSTVLPMTGQTSYILSVQGSGPLFNISIHPLAGRFVPNLIYLSVLFLSLFIEVALLLPCTILHPLCQPLSILKNIWQLSLLSLVSQAAVCPQCHNYHLCIWGYSLVFGYRNCSTRRYNASIWKIVHLSPIHPRLFPSSKAEQAIIVGLYLQIDGILTLCMYCTQAGLKVVSTQEF